MKAICINQHGGPDVLKNVEIPIPDVRANNVLVRNQAIGVNYVDIQHRQGGYYPMQLPLIPGIEAAGIVERIGKHVTRFKVGDAVVYAGYMGGNYAQYTLVPENQLIPIPDGIDFETAAAGVLQAMTAHCLTHDVYPVKAGDSVLVHAAAGGVGSLLVQIANQQGATVIGTTSSEQKADFAKQMGAQHVILYREHDFAGETMRLTNSEGVHVVFDAIGKTTFDRSLSVLRKRGYMVVYGQTSGAVPPFDINRLSGLTDSSTKGSLFLTWAALSHYNTTYDELITRANIVLQLMRDEQIYIHIHARLPLEQAQTAHQLMENREIIGKVMLIP